MGMDIRSKSGLHLKMGYGAFHFMKGELLENMCKGFGNFYEWAASNGPLAGIECRYNKDTPELQLPYKTGRMAFTTACNELLATWLKANGLGFAWKHLFCHCDCGGGWTKNQVKRLCKDLDRMNGGMNYGNEFMEFRQLFHNASENNEGLNIT